jgi:acetyl esterase/lipase
MPEVVSQEKKQTSVIKPTFANVPYVPNGGERQQLDIYLPANYQEVTKLPVLVWIHGGGWMQGSKDDVKMILSLMPGKNFIDQGYVCVGINYRFFGQSTLANIIEDCKTAIRWLRANAKTYNLDPDRIGVWGASAGGHLAAMIGTSPHKKELEVGENLDQSSAVQAVCDIFGPTDFTRHSSEPSQPIGGAFDAAVRLLGGTAEQRELVSPIYHITKDCPPFLIIHGTEDKLVSVDQSTRFYDALKKAGIEADIIIMEGVGHDTGIATPETMKKVTEFFDKNVKKASSP